MRSDQRPYWLKKWMDRISDGYARRILHPQFDSLGAHSVFRNPRKIEVMGPNIRAGDHLHAMATNEAPISLMVWMETEGHIDLGNYVALSPGVRIKSACSIEIGDGALIAERVFITDCDWHDFYDRIFPPGPVAPVRIDENVWIADGAIVCKGVTIGRNSVVGAGAIVTADVPANTVVAGNPARPIKQLDPEGKFITRRQMFEGDKPYDRFEDEVAYRYLSRNTFSGWLRSMFAPTREM